VLYRDMSESFPVLEHLSDSDLLAEVKRLAGCEQLAIAKLVSALAEFDARRLHLGQGCSSMFTYCTQVLHLAEHAAFNRIEAARAARRFPIILELLADGRVHLSAIRLLAPHLSEANHEAVLREASHKTKREVEQIVARLLPRANAASSVRKLPSKQVPATTTPSPVIDATLVRSDAQPTAVAALTQRPKTEPLAPGRFKVQFTIGYETYAKLRRVQDLLRHRLPNGDLAEVFDRALTLLLADLQRSKLAATERPRASSAANRRSRHVPAKVRRAVWARDGGQCRFEGPAGRCRETGLLEFHHVIPYARGGPTTVENLELRCAAHNRYEAEQCFGWFVREVADTYEPSLTF
jgi:HNH endonuclease